jgi:hypothetical protein
MSSYPTAEIAWPKGKCKYCQAMLRRKFEKVLVFITIERRFGTLLLLAKYVSNSFDDKAESPSKLFSAGTASQ